MPIQSLHDLAEHAQIEHIRKNGGYNAFPPHWQQIDAAEYAKSRHFTFHPVLFEHRQMLPRDVNGRVYAPAISVTLWWQSDGTGYTEVNDFWAGTIKFYKFGERPADLVENFDSSD